MKISTKVITGLLLIASVVAVAAMIHGAGKFEWSRFHPWVIGPYIILALIFCLPLSQSHARSVAGCVSAAVVLAFTCLFYIDAMWVSVSSTSALIFIFAPVYLFAGGLIVWGITWFVLERRAGRSNHRG
jgi:uncharacterized membrane protein YesL